LFLTLTSATACLVQGAEQGLPKHSPPHVEGKPVEVKVGFQILDFARVNAREESFDLTTYLSLSWDDTRLARADAFEGGSPRHFQPGEIWVPTVFFPNALEQMRNQQGPDIEVDDRGHVIWSTCLCGRFSSPLDLRFFPFDGQALIVRMGSYHDVREVVFRVDPHHVSVSRRAFLSDWEIVGIDGREVEYQYPPDVDPYSHVEFATSIRRRSTFYIWRVLLPITLLVMAAWSVFWFEPVNLQPQISTCLGLCLSLVTFHFGVDFALPKVNYLTLTDKHALNGLVFVLGALVIVTIVHRLVQKQRMDDALRLQWAFRLVYPLLYSLAVAAEFLSSFAPAVV
jgi:hypothetical protein